MHGAGYCSGRRISRGKSLGSFTIGKDVVSHKECPGVFNVWLPYLRQGAITTGHGKFLKKG